MPLYWTAWNNGKHLATGAGYGIKVPIVDRDEYFDPVWRQVILEFPIGGTFTAVAINTDKPSFWNASCHELINKEIGSWLVATGLAPWPNGKPPKLSVEVVGEGRFRVLTEG